MRRLVPGLCWHPEPPASSSSELLLSWSPLSLKPGLVMCTLAAPLGDPLPAEWSSCGFRGRIASADDPGLPTALWNARGAAACPPRLLREQHPLPSLPASSCSVSAPKIALYLPPFQHEVQTVLIPGQSIAPSSAAVISSDVVLEPLENVPGRQMLGGCIAGQRRWTSPIQARTGSWLCSTAAPIATSPRLRNTWHHRDFSIFQSGRN